MDNDIPLTWFLYFAAASFAIGLAGVLVRRNAIAVLMAIEIMLNAANINLVAFWRYGPSGPKPARWRASSWPSWSSPSPRPRSPSASA